MNIIFLDFDGVMTSMRETPGSYLLGEKHTARLSHVSICSGGYAMRRTHGS